MKTSITSFVVAVSLVLPSLASAAPVATATDVAVQATPATSCVVITRTVYPGARSADVSKLQSVLQAKGFLDSAPTGYFGAMTSAAVKKFQAANALEATGSVGPRTRALIQSLSCGNTVAPVASPAVPTTSVKPTTSSSNNSLVITIDETPKTKAPVAAIAHDSNTSGLNPVSPIVVDNFVASFGPSPVDGKVRAGLAMFSFKITNNGKGPISLSKIPSLSVGTSSAGSAGSPAVASSTISMFGTMPHMIDGDTGFAPVSGSFVVPAGTTRMFTYYGFLDNTNGVAGIRVFRITNINYTDANGLPQTITKGIPNTLVVTPYMDGGSAENPGPTINTIGLRVENPVVSFEPTVSVSGAGNAISLASAGTMTFKFTAVSTGNKPIYISKIPGFALSTSTEGASITSMIAGPAVMTGDKNTGWMSGSYIVPAGQSRDFTFTGPISNANGVTGVHTFKITKVHFGSSPQGTLQLSSVETPELSLSVTLGGTVVPPTTGFLPGSNASVDLSATAPAAAALSVTAASDTSAE